MAKVICKECGQPFEAQDRHDLICDYCLEEIAQAEDEESEDVVNQKID